MRSYKARTWNIKKIASHKQTQKTENVSIMTGWDVVTNHWLGINVGYNVPQIQYEFCIRKLKKKKKFTSLPAQLSRVGENSTHPHQCPLWYCSSCSTSTRLALCSHYYSQKLFRQCYEVRVQSHSTQGKLLSESKQNENYKTRVYIQTGTPDSSPKKAQDISKEAWVCTLQRRRTSVSLRITLPSLSWEREPRHPREGFHLPVSVSIYHTTLG